jgi:anti-anti-sigma factor
MRWSGQQAVLTLPEQIDVSNAGQVREALLAAINRGATSLIADMTATISCDYAGADAVVRACQQAILTGTELRLVVTAQIVRRVLSTSGLDRLVAIYPSLESATAARAPAVIPGAPPADGRAPPDSGGLREASTAGPFTLAVIRDVTETRRREDLAAPARAAVTAEQQHRRRDLLDTIITTLFDVGLSLQDSIDLPASGGGIVPLLPGSFRVLFLSRIRFTR